MAPPSSSFLVLVLTVWSSSQLLLAQSMEGSKLSNHRAEMPNGAQISRPLSSDEKLRNYATEMAMEYMAEEGGRDHAQQPQVNLAKRAPPSVKREDVGDDEIRSMYLHFVRRNIPPSLVKFNYGKRSADKRYRSPFFFGKRAEDMDDTQFADDNGLSNDMTEDKRNFSPFTFGKREMEGTSSRWAESAAAAEKRQVRHNPFVFGKRHDDDDEADTMSKRGRSRFSSLYFGKRVPEMTKKGFSRLYFGKRGDDDAAEKRFSKFMFGKREEEQASDGSAEDGDNMSEEKRFKSRFYFGKRLYSADEMDNTNDMETS